MFGVDWSNPQTQWLNYTDLILGIVTLAILLFVVVSLLRSLIGTRRYFVRDPRSMHTPGIGRTMADGGEPVPNGPRRREKPSKPQARKKNRLDPNP